jgi:exodeoxyribonuclease VII small subunit
LLHLLPMNTQESTYKASISRLEQILENIDDPDTGIDELASQVKEAAEHLQTCRTILVRTEKEINEALQKLENVVVSTQTNPAADTEESPLHD